MSLLAGPRLLQIVGETEFGSLDAERTPKVNTWRRFVLFESTTSDGVVVCCETRREGHFAGCHLKLVLMADRILLGSC
jgi:hypothetical protein